MKTPKHSLRKIVSFLNNRDEEGGFWLPNIQRHFVWSEDQICRLFDSILREYPISTLLIWKTKSQIRHRKFIDNYHGHLKLTDFYVPDNTDKKCLVLDGQQRLQSLFIGLCGSHEGRELYLDILSGELTAPDDMKYRFRFLHASQASFPWIKFKDIVFSKQNPRALARTLIGAAERPLTQNESEKIDEHVSIIFKTFHADDGIAYQELDSTENQQLYSEDDVVEIFIRANSGGTRLGKSDLLFSLLSSTWDEADKEMDLLLEELNSQGFSFTRDFVLKTCLTLLDQGAQYEVAKFRKPTVRVDIEKRWDDITKAIKDVYDFVRGKTFIRGDKAMPSYLVLIPLVYLRYRYPAAWKNAKNVATYLIRSLLTGAFSGTPDRLIDDCVKVINETEQFDLGRIFEVIRSQGRSLELTTDKFWQMGYGSDTIHLLFNLWYRDFHYTPAYDGNFPQVDHIFPQSALRKVKQINLETGKSVMKYREAERNQLANCMLLTQQENGAGGKGEALPEYWFADKSDEYLDMHLIPKDRELWAMDSFEDFIVERQKLIQSKFGYLLVDIDGR
ncbi:DUF262 domain-containing HNH endonuclease family protein [Candidatus Amarolinea dominans]|uniref:DUF262 domain-containing HNH endonuclease family protein n=1 Tax=Candidatus Amarolinea dominans TaxID=3140696 RepID=UPI001E14AAED|nr:DUF262 domain-containing protein [Anaerolineae bacterium]MBK9231682.1 DUF262 domain-containing protein [Anaerolineae bacterium]